MRTNVRVLLLLWSLLIVVACSGAKGEAFAVAPADAGAAPDEDDASPVIITSGDDDDDTSDPIVVDADAGPDDPVDDDAGEPLDPPPDGACPAAPGAGDLAVVELMIASVSGSGDHGEWVEIASQRDCTLDLRGLHGDVPVGAKVATFDIDDDLWLLPRGSLVVADSSDPAIEHDLPTPLFTWLGEPGDVLRNQGSTLTLRVDGVIVDSVTYPASKLAPGVSLAFPADCDVGARGSWELWQPSAGSWFPGFFGTPNAPNTDVHCHATD